jgi:hypothetical protein
MTQTNKYKPSRSCIIDRRINRADNKPRNYHSFEVNQTWRKFRHSFKRLNLKGDIAFVVNEWEDSYETSAFMTRTD